MEGQNRILKQAILKNPDAILISPSVFTESNSLLQGGKEIRGYGSHLLTPIQKKVFRRSQLPTDNVEAGEKPWEFCGFSGKPEDQIAIVAHVKGVSTAVEREKGFRDRTWQFEEKHCRCGVL